MTNSTADNRHGARFVASVTGGLLAAMILRLVWYDGRPLLIWLNSFTLYLYLPAYACLAWSLWRRRAVLALLNAVLIAFHIVLVSPDFYRSAAVRAPGESGQIAAPAAPTLRLFYANVCRHNREYAAVLSAIGQVQADVVTLVELDELWIEQIHASSEMKELTYREVSSPPGGELIGVFSRFPLVDVEADRFASNRTHPVDLQLGDHQLRLLTIHAPRPVGYKWDLYRFYWQRIEQLVSNQPEPLAIVGDLNATQYSKAYRMLTSGRLRGAHEDRGRGYATTWPAGRYWAPPIRIDHALLSPGVECLKIEEATIPGSDHRGLVLELRIHQDRAAQEVALVEP